MADQTVRPSSPQTAKPPVGVVERAQGLAEQASAAGRDIKDRVADIASSSSDALKEQAADFTDAAKNFASQAGEKLKDRVNDQKDFGAEYVGNLAETIRRAAREFDNDLPFAANYIRKAADQVENVSNTVRDGDFDDLVRGAQQFARRQPTAFLGLAVLAGFGAIRFLKSSAGPDNDDMQSGRGQSATRQRARSPGRKTARIDRDDHAE